MTLALEKNLLQSHDKVQIDSINKESEKEEDIGDRTIFQTMVGFGNLLLCALQIFVKWTVLVNGKENKKKTSEK